MYMKTRLAFLFVALLTWAFKPVMVMADTKYISNVMVVGADSKSVANQYYDIYVSQGWIGIHEDLNENAGGHYVYMLYKTTEDPSQAITDFYLRIMDYNSPAPSTFTHNGHTYYQPAYNGDNEFCHSKGNLNCEAGGDYQIHLYYTKDAGLPNRVIGFYFNDNASGALGENGGSTPCDLNKDAGGDDIFMHVAYERNHIIDLQYVTTNRVFEHGDVLTGTLTHNVRLAIAKGATVTLSNVTINGVHSDTPDANAQLPYKWAGLSCEGDATIILDGTNKIRGFHKEHPGIQAGGSGNTVVIRGDGSLDVSSNGEASGIGCHVLGDCGNIIIKSGTITAQGGLFSAGIGNSYCSKCGNITIMGGTVYAQGGQNAAGIGTGVTIDWEGEGGDPWDGGDASNPVFRPSICGYISISGGNVTAIGGGDHAAGIGLGIEGECDDIYISGGNVYAMGKGDAAGIGSAPDAGITGNIYISGGTVYAKGGEGGAGIGSCKMGITGSISITGGTVTAIRGDQVRYSIWATMDATENQYDFNPQPVVIGDKKIEKGCIAMSPYIITTLDEDADNAEAWNAISKTPNAFGHIMLKRTMKAGAYHAFSVPFDISKEMLTEMGIAAEKLTASTLDSQTGQLSLTFDKATETEAGVPYLIRIKNDLVNPVFEGVPLGATTTKAETDLVDFIPLTAPGNFATADNTILLAGDGERLTYPSAAVSAKATAAYFKLKGAAVGASDVRLIFTDDNLPTVTFDAYTDNTQLFEQYKNQLVNARLTGRTYQAKQKADGTWQAYAYSICLPFDMSLVDNENVEVYKLQYIEDNSHFVFVRKAPYLYAGESYLIVVRKESIELKADGVQLVSKNTEGTEVVDWYDNEEPALGRWRGTLQKIEHSDAASQNAYIMQKDGTFKRIKATDNAWVGAFVSAFYPSQLTGCDSYKIKLGEVYPGGGPEEDYTTDFPADAFDTDCDIEDGTGIALIDNGKLKIENSADAWSDLQGRKLQGKPTQKGIYIYKGKKVKK